VGNAKKNYKLMGQNIFFLSYFYVSPQFFQYFMNLSANNENNNEGGVFIKVENGFQQPATPIMEGIIDFHHDIMFFLVFIFFFVVAMLFIIIRVFTNKFIALKIERIASRNTHNLILETIWTIIPACILVSIVLPSFALIYSLDEFFLHPRVTLKAIGNQWYWTYNYGCSFSIPVYNCTEYAFRRYMILGYAGYFDLDIMMQAIKCQYAMRTRQLGELLEDYFGELYDSWGIQTYYHNRFKRRRRSRAFRIMRKFEKLRFYPTLSELTDAVGLKPSFNKTHHLALKFDSYLESEEFQKHRLRLLDVDKRLLIPSKTGLRILISSYDVLHSWAVPSFGIKVDGCPGRLNQTFLYVKHDGIFYGQCSEICGVNHGFMPIVARTLPLPAFSFWLTSHINNVNAVIDVTGIKPRYGFFPFSVEQRRQVFSE